MFRKLLIAAAVLVVSLILAAPALADPAYAPIWPLATAVGTQDAPSVGWSFTAWEDNAAGNWDVFIRPFAVPILVPVGASNQCHPAAGNNWVVYEDDRNGNWDIYAFDTDQITTPTPAPTPTDIPLSTSVADQLDPAIAGNRVVFEDKSRGNWDISIFNLATGVFGHVTTNRAAQRDPAIEGTRVVYADHRNGNWDIYCYDLKTRREKRLTTNRADQTKPQIGQGVVVYQDNRNGNWDIYDYTLKTGKERRLTTNPHNQTAPQISPFGYNRYVVYQDDRDGAGDVYLVDLATGISKPVTVDPAAQTTPVILQDNIVWCDARGADADIYATWLEYSGVTLHALSGTPNYNASVTIHGYLDLTAGSVAPAAGQKVFVVGSRPTRSVTVQDIGNPLGGSISVPFTHVVRKVTFHVLYRGDADNLPALSNTVTIKPRALLTRPTAVRVVEPSSSPYPIILPSSADFIVKGFLKPHHRAGSLLVTISVYKYSLVKNWYLLKRVKARLSNYGTYSQYRAVIHLSNGSYKFQARHSDADHALTYSPVSAIVRFGLAL